jgi:hypothetical protein
VAEPAGLGQAGPFELALDVAQVAPELLGHPQDDGLDLMTR